MPLATSDFKGAVLYRRRGTAVLFLVALIVAGCSDSDSAGGAGPDFRPVSAGHIRLDLLPSFRSLLSDSGLRLVWNPPPCSWRLDPPACGGQPATDMSALEIPIVGGSIGIEAQRKAIQGRLELAGRVDVAGSDRFLALDDITIHPEVSMLIAGSPAGRVEALFLDGTRRTFDTNDDRVVIGGIEVKLLVALLEQIRLTLGPTTSLSELVKVGDLTMTVDVGG